MTQETDRETGEMFKRLSLHFGACVQCQTAFKQSRHNKRQTVRPCETGYRISMEWLEHQAGRGDSTAQMYLKGIEEIAGLS